MFSICVLLYGDYPALARRCLESIKNRIPQVYVQDYRIGLNLVSPATVKYVFEEFPWEGSPPVYLYSGPVGPSTYKYPLMRKMFLDRKRLLADHVMWFDDDSYVKAGDDFSLSTDVLRLLKQSPVVGAIYTLNCGWRPGQIDGIKQQPWYTGRPHRSRPSFLQGGWWAAQSSFLQRWSYPFKELVHNNGDVLLGELCYQQGCVLGEYRKGMAINADAQGRESRAQRRGVTTLWPWQNGYVYDPSVHDFNPNVITLNPS